MIDFEAAVAAFVRSFRKGRVLLPPSLSRADLVRFWRSSRNGSASGARVVRGYDCDAGKRTYAAEGGISP